MNDERKRKPSASYIERMALCPGSWNMEKNIPSPPETEDAAMGTRIHNALAGLGDVVLAPEEQDIADTCLRLRKRACLEVLGTEEPEIELREERFWIPEVVSGKGDYTAINGSDALILDYKTGRAAVEEAKGNLQLRALAALLWINRGPLNSVTVGIIQPFAKTSISLSKYSLKQLSKAYFELLYIVISCNKPDAPRIPGEKQCKYCKAKATCPEALGVALQVAKEGSGGVYVPTKDQVQSAVAAMTAENLGNMLDRCRVAEMVIEAAKENAKARLEAGEEIPGYRLKEGSTRSTITNPAKVFDRFAAQGGSVSDFLSCITVKNGALKAQFRELTGAKGKGLEMEFNALIEGCTETKETAMQLERVNV